MEDSLRLLRTMGKEGKNQAGVQTLLISRLEGGSMEGVEEQRSHEGDPVAEHRETFRVLFEMEGEKAMEVGGQGTECRGNLQ